MYYASFLLPLRCVMYKKDSRGREDVVAAFDMAMLVEDIEVVCGRLGISCFLNYLESEDKMLTQQVVATSAMLTLRDTSTNVSSKCSPIVLAVDSR